MKNRAIAGLLATAAAVIPYAAHCQAIADSGDKPAGSADESKLAEVVVTAQKREQRLQDVPIAITAVNQDYIEQRGITSIADLNALAPNLKVNTAGANKTTSILAIRGGVQSNPQIYFEPSVGVYLNGVYIAKAQGSLFDVADIERIEVLRGPQGTLYGRNTIAGALNIIARNPSGEFGGRIEASLGNFDYRRLRGTVDLPAIGPFSAKLSGQIAKRDGFTRVIGNAFTDEADSLDSTSGMVQIRAQPVQPLILDYVFDISVNDQQAGYSQTVSGVGPLAPFVRPRRRQETVSFDSPNFEYARNWGHALTAALDLGNIGTLKSITALRRQRYRDALELDGAPIALALSSRDSNYKQLSQELQLTGETGRLSYVTGAYYFHDDGFVFNPQSFFFGASRTDSRFGFTTKAYAAYAQLDYKPTEALTLTGGLRYTHEKKTIERFLARLSSPPAVIVDLAKGVAPPATFEKVSPSATLAYEFNADINAYARYAQGYRSGGFNGTAGTTADVLRVFEPQVQDTYEIGLKSRLFDRRLQLNVAAFENIIKDLQLSVFRPGISAASILVNAGKARIYGLEVEAIVQPIDDLLLQASFGYLDGKYLEYIDGGVDVANNRPLTHSPKYTATTSANWTALRGGFGKLDFIADFSLLSSYYISPNPLRPTAPTQTPASFTRSPGRAILDARAVLSEFPLGHATGTLSVWGRNLLDEDRPNFFIDFGASFLRLTTANFPDARTYGVTLEARF